MVFTRFRTLAWSLAAAGALFVPGCDCDEDPDPDPPPVPPLVVSSLSPLQGAVTGGTTVTILGAEFTAAGGVDSVTFGGSAGTSLSLVSAGQLTVVTPSGSAGPADVVVSSTGLGQSVTETNGFTYLSGPAPAPALTSVTPAGGPPLGGNTVTLLGSAFQAGATVDFGGTAATNVQVLTAGRATCTVPAGSVGAVTVTITNPDLQTGPLPNGYTYSNPPVVTAISPITGFTDGGDTVTITGTGFTGGATADIGGAVVSILSVTPVQIIATTGARGPGDVAVTVCNPGAICGSGSSYAYRYGPNSQTNAFTFDTASGIDCRRRWHLDFRPVVQTDLLTFGLQTTNAPDAANAYAVDWFRGYVLSAVNQMYGRNADGSANSGSSLNVTFMGQTPPSGSPGCAVPATDYSRMCIGGCAPTSATGCTGNGAGCAGPTVGLSQFDNISGGACGSNAENNCSAPAYGGGGCTGIFVRDIGNLWGGGLVPSLVAGDLQYLDGSIRSGTRYTAIHTALQQLAYRAAMVVAHECAHSMGIVAGLSVSPCTMSSGLCAATNTHNDCCNQNIMRSSASFGGTFGPTSFSFSGRPGTPTSNPACASGGASSWSQLTSFIGLSP